MQIVPPVHTGFVMDYMEEATNGAPHGLHMDLVTCSLHDW